MLRIRIRDPDVKVSIFEKGTAWFLQIENNIEKVGQASNSAADPDPVLF
jgi:hypothetical protein